MLSLKKLSSNINDQIKKHKGKILGMTLSSDSKSLVSIAADKSVRIWRLVGNKYTAWKYESPHAGFDSVTGNGASLLLSSFITLVAS